MKNLLSILLFIAFVIFNFQFLAFNSAAYAQSIPSCDQCGYCIGNKIPGDYYNCVSCVYDLDLSESSPPTEPISAPAVEGRNWMVTGCISTSPSEFTQSIISFVTRIVGGVIFIFLLYGSFLILTSSGEPEKLSQGKSIIKSGIIALILILFSVFILQFVGSDLLKIPGFE